MSDADLESPPADGGAAASEQATVDAFHRLYYEAGPRTWQDTRWLGVRALKCPMDLWAYQEILHDVRPELVVETGTFEGGSALFLASVMDQLGRGSVLSIDIEERPGRPRHRRVRYLRGSSVAPKVLKQVHRAARRRGRVLVVLDSDHSRDHVLSELRAYAPFVSVGSYLVVEDTNVNAHPVLPEFGPRPAEAVEIFLGEHLEFVRDRSREKLMMTFNPGGFLRRQA